MTRDDRVADIENMSLSELAALEADVVRRVEVGDVEVREVTAGTIEERVRALRREVSSH